MDSLTTNPPRWHDSISDEARLTRKYKPKRTAVVPISNLEYLPIEVQASVADLRAAGVPEPIVTILIDRTFHALEAQVTGLQLDVIRIEEGINRRVGRIGEKLRGDLRTQHGATNDMLIDIRDGQQHLEAAVLALRNEFQAADRRLTGVEGRTDALEAKVAAHDQSRDQSIAERLLLRQDMDESKRHRQRIQIQLDDLTDAVQRIEQLLEVAGNHDAEHE